MRRLAGALFVVVGAGLLLSGGWAAAATPADPVSQDVPAAGDDEGLLVFASRSRNESCSVTRNVLNRTGGALDVRVLSSSGEELDARTLGGGQQVTFSIHHDVVTVPLLLQVGGDEPVELAQVGPFAPCDQPGTTVPPTTAPTTPTTGPAVTTTPAPTTPSTPSTVPEPTVTTMSTGGTVPAGPTTSAPSVSPATTPTTRVAGAPPVSVLSAQVTTPSLTRLPTTGGQTRSTLVLGLSSIAVGLAFLLSARTARAVGRRGDA